jgi:chromosome segregation ATPase
LTALKSEIESLRDQLRKAEQPPITASADSDEVRQENKVLRRLLDEAEADLRQFKNEVGGGREAGASSAESAALQNELQALRDQLSQKDGLIAELKEEAKSHPIGDPESYEAELNRFRKELEADRSRLNKEIESLRLRNSELDDATRELEMELSRERAEMARERIRLDRMRDEVKADMERLQREHEVRGTLGSVQKLREEIVQKAGGPPKNAADRLRSMSKLPQ